MAEMAPGGAVVLTLRIKQLVPDPDVVHAEWWTCDNASPGVVADRLRHYATLIEENGVLYEGVKPL